MAHAIYHKNSMKTREADQSKGREERAMKRENIKNSVILYQSKNIKEKLRMTHFDLLHRSIHSIKKNILLI